ncbi:hypothetical protein J2X97_003275 [Epilithonimonas hungarica]|uniref:hypothetical protein n=1 Tax=Epilithonimonas hungarica TaxID=454006 RepID=UPI0027899661|nr:hypothetical protein [Epilithonimonas hungarica]MDP9957606.1 hypothetical protein [Epilithonimonas hungarica]
MKIYFIFFLSLFLFSCSSSTDNEMQELTVPQLTTKELSLDDEGFLKLGGKITNNGGSQISKVGVIWSTSSNVSLENYATEDKEEMFSSNENFEFKSKKIFAPNTTYYFRAFAQNNRGTALGNVVSYKYGNVIETLDPTEITTVSATLNGKFYQPLGNLSYAGFVYATHSEPTIFDNGTSSVAALGTMNFNIQLTGLTRNTDYYIRSYTKIDNRYYYGEEKKIKTAGYFGPAGGIVAYDKGIVSDGWRYLEISNKDVGRNYATAGFYRFGAVWSTSPASYLAGTSEKMGDGLSNTNFIISKLSGESAAKFCADHSVNGFSDWFLPSKEEAVAIITSLYKGGMSLQSGLSTWTSSEIDTQQAFFINSPGLASGYQKIGDNKTYPVRRY